jgi:DNA-binding transcriptional ArsR family regulator
MSVAAESLATFAGLLSDRSRAAMCLAMLDGRAWTAGELAAQAGIGRPTATEHLNLLVAAGLLIEVRQGRCRYLQLAGPEIARLLEELTAAAGQPERPRSLRAVRASAELAAARTCYDHLAGALGVALFDGLVAAGALTSGDGLSLTEAGRAWFTELAGAEALAPASGRPVLRSCLDWTQRRPHLSGALGAAMCSQFMRRGWVVRRQGSRAVRLTGSGAEAVDRLLGLQLAAS